MDDFACMVLVMLLSLIRLAVATSALFLSMVIPSTSHAHDLEEPCPGYSESGSSSADIDRHYVGLAISIVKAGLKSDIEALSKLVSADAGFANWRGDYSTVGRKRGPQGAIAWSLDLRPTTFSSSSVRNDMISVTHVPGTCEWNGTVLFRTDKGGTGVTVKFKFVDGLLVGATGYEVVLMEGTAR